MDQGNKPHSVGARVELAYAYGGPLGDGLIRQRFAEFRVDENLGFELTGEGEHVFLKVEKQGVNTENVACCLAKYARLPRRHVSYAGLKDRRALITQWFSVHLPGMAGPDWTGFVEDGIRIVDRKRHQRKLKKGSLQANQFKIRVREIDCPREKLFERLETIQQKGVPNYFGPQRFGRDGNNHLNAIRYFRGELKIRDRHKRGLYLSAARSYLFNELLAVRIARRNWNRALAGDAMILGDAHSFFACEEPDDEIHGRVERLEIHPSGPLWGKGLSDAGGAALMIENAVSERNKTVLDGLQRNGLAMARRSLRLKVDELAWHCPDQSSIVLDFSLAAGGYATCVLRELFNIRQSGGLQVAGSGSE